jgi:Uma2 family endonuclease
MSVQVMRRLFTVDEYYQMAEAGILSEDDRVELIKGEIVKMSPISARHAAAVDRLTQLFITKLRGAAIVRTQNPIHLNEYTEPEPDIALVQTRPDFYAEAHPEPEDVLLLIEVAETSLAYDRDVKIPLYAQAGIAEVWVVDLSGKSVMVYRQPMSEGYGYKEVRQALPGNKLSPQIFPRLEVTVATLLGQDE